MKISSISISGVLTLDMHALNNEGSEGNFTETRQVAIIDGQGQQHAVNAISGDMFKHIMCSHMLQLGTAGGIGLINFCEGCKVLDPNRINADSAFLAAFKKDETEVSILDGVIQKCAGDDLNGILITQDVGGKKRSIGRKSISEFSWVIGIPESVVTENYFHVKFDVQRRKSAGGTGAGSNLGQAIFHRPANSGQYAVVCGADLFRIGMNDISLEHSIDAAERDQRARLLLESILATFLKPTGAQRNTQMPHIVDFKGVVAISSTRLPAPTVSPINKDFLKQIEKITYNLNELAKESITLKPFDSLSDFSGIIVDLANDIHVA